MKSTKEPSFSLYPADMLGLTHEEVGAYIALLTRQHAAGPFTEDQAIRLISQFLWDSVKHKFTKNPDGLYMNVRLAEDKTKSKKYSESRRNNQGGGFKKPGIGEIVHYFAEKKCYDAKEAEKFFDFYESKGWMVGKSKMKSWKSAVNNWIRRKNEQGQNVSRGSNQVKSEANKYDRL